MSHLRQVVMAVVVFVATTIVATPALATPLLFTLQLSGGLPVSVNGGASTPSGAITMTAVVDDTAPDLEPDSNFGEFAATSVSFTGAGFVNVGVTTPLSLVTILGGSHFALQRLGELNEGVIGWNGATSAGAFMTDVNALSTITALPYTTAGNSTFWGNGLGADVWILSTGDTIGANVPNGGPAGTFSISRPAAVPEPATLFLLGTGLGIAVVRRRMKQRT